MLARKFLLSENDAKEIRAFERYLTIAKWREMELEEPHGKAKEEAAIVVYGDKYAEEPAK